MVDVARFFLDFVQDESCGKCVAVPRRHQADAGDPQPHLRGPGRGGRHRAADRRWASRSRTRRCAAWARRRRTRCSRPSATSATSTIAHIRDKHCPAGVCPALVQRAVPERLPGRRGRARLRLAGRREALRRGPAPAPRAQPVRGRLRARLLPHLRGQVPPRRRWTSRSRSAASSGSWSSRKSRSSCPRSARTRQNAKRKIAIVGAGPAGLSCAYFLARLGYRPKVFEAEPRPGGMLVQAIPAYRLPREELAREVRMIERMGVEIETNMRLGEDFTLPEPARRGLRGRVPGRRRAAGRGPGHPRRGRRRASPTPSASCASTTSAARCRSGKNVVVIGGGNAAIDAARTALRLGAEDGHASSTAARREEMPAYEEEIEEAEHEGVRAARRWSRRSRSSARTASVAGVQVPPHGAGRVRPQRPPPARASRGRRVRRRGRPGDRWPSARRSTRRSCSTASQLKLDARRLHRGRPGDRADLGAVDLRRRRRGHRARRRWSRPWRPARRAAVGIDLYLTGEEHAFWRRPSEVGHRSSTRTPSRSQYAAREDEADAGRASASDNFDEVELPWSETVAVREAKRCLRCDYRRRATKPD